VKRGLTLERHIEVGARLSDLSGELTTLLVETNQHYPVGSPQVQRLKQVVDRLAKARSSLDDAVYREHDDACAHIYYPLTEDEGRGSEHLVALPHRCGTSSRAGAR